MDCGEKLIILRIFCFLGLITSFYVDNILGEDSPTLIQDFPVLNNTFAFQNSTDIGLPTRAILEPITIDAPAFGIQGDPNGSNVVYPTGFQLQPRRDTNYGLSVQFRFGR